MNTTRKTLTKSMMIALVSIAASATPANASDVFEDYRYDTAAAAHGAALAIQPSDHEVLGDYVMIATASRSYKGDFAKVDAMGIVNQDGSVLHVRFDRSTDGGFNVTQTNLGASGQNQGPSAATAGADGTAQFAQYSYRAGQINDDVYFISECKKMGDNVRLICAKRFIANRPDRLKPEQRALHDTIIGYDLYSK